MPERKKTLGIMQDSFFFFRSFAVRKSVRNRVGFLGILPPPLYQSVVSFLLRRQHYRGPHGRASHQGKKKRRWGWRQEHWKGEQEERKRRRKKRLVAQQWRRRERRNRRRGGRGGTIIFYNSKNMSVKNNKLHFFTFLSLGWLVHKEKI